ncbi:DUF3096 domain-containing protein [Chloroflexota bacterium]
MNIVMSKMAMGIIAIIAGILVLAVPAILGWVVGIVLIVYGILILIGKK